MSIREVVTHHDVTVSLPPCAYVGGLWATELRAVVHDVNALDHPGRWVAVIPYSGTPVFLLFERWELVRPDWAQDSWTGPFASEWSSSLDEVAYCNAVERTRSAIERGDVYQANVCRVLTASIPEPQSMLGLFDRLVAGNPSPHATYVHAPEAGIEIASASPELFLRREGDVISSGPIKGTGRTEADLLDKDLAENVMIVDLVRNDLSRLCEAGSVEVPRLLSVEAHPGLVHLVSEVSGRLRSDVTWSQILGASFPPGSVTGAPKSSALRLIASLEPAPRHVYCGALGWIDSRTGSAELAVAIRTFWQSDGLLRFGTGAGITWGSDPQAEWRETELKADRLIRLASEEAT